MRKRRGPGRVYITLGFILFASVAFVALYVREGNDGALHRVQNAIRDTFTSPLAVFKGGVGAFRDWVTGVVRAGALARENRLLREQVRESRRLVLEARDLQRENERLRRALGFRSRFAYATVPAEVVLVHQELSGRLYTIDRGSQDGIAVDDPVLTPDGLFGKVWQVGKRTSVVLPLNHPLSAVSVRIVETNEVGILEGSRDGTLRLRLIPKESRATIGDVCVTSGLGTVFPKGLYVGSILTIEDEQNRLDRGIVVGSAVDFEGADFVFVLTRTTTGTASP